MGVEVEKEEKANNGQQTEGCEEKLVGPADDSVDSQAPTTAQLTVTSTSSPYNTTTTTVIKPRRFHIRRMGDNKFVLNQSCCRCSLRSGSIAIGICGMIFSTASAAYSIYEGVMGSTRGWIDLAVNLIIIAISATLLLGIKLEKRCLVMAWVWVSGILIIINFVLGCIYLVSLNIIGGVILFIMIAVVLYCFLVVRSYAISLSDSSGEAI